MYQVGIFGEKLSHSLSPVFQNVAFEYCEIQALYEIWELSPDQLLERVNLLRQSNTLGANVTIPYKELAYNMVDELDETALQIGAINTIVNNSGVLKGYNTDITGFIRSLKEVASFLPSGKNVLILGAGGAARAAIFGLLNENVNSITVANRTEGRAVKMLDDFGVNKEIFKTMSIYDKNLTQVSLNSDLIINATSVGMQHSEMEDETLLSAHQIPRNCVVYDIVYNPLLTPLLKNAQIAGAEIMQGLWMLIFQGVDSFELWTGKSAPVQKMYKKAMETFDSQH
ncbi:MAG: shikimate dehydrogenase [Dehalococcoidia bacterium]